MIYTYSLTPKMSEQLYIAERENYILAKLLLQQ